MKYLKLSALLTLVVVAGYFTWRKLDQATVYHSRIEIIYERDLDIEQESAEENYVHELNVACSDALDIANPLAEKLNDDPTVQAGVEHRKLRRQVADEVLVACNSAATLAEFPAQAKRVVAQSRNKLQWSWHVHWMQIYEDRAGEIREYMERRSLTAELKQELKEADEAAEFHRRQAMALRPDFKIDRR